MSGKIEKLTQEQIDRFPEFIKKWTDIGLSTQPANRPEAESAIKEMYQIAGLTAPHIVWCGSPLSQGITRAILQKMPEIKSGDSVGDSVWDSVWDSVRDSVGASVRDSVRDSVRASVWDSVQASVGDSVWDSVWDSVRDSVGASVRDSVRDSVGDSVWDSVWDSVRDSVGASVRDSVRDSVRASVRDSVGASVRDSVRASVWDSVQASVQDSVGDSVRASVWDSVWDSVRDSVYGSHEAGWLGFYDYFLQVFGLKTQTEKLSGLWKLSQNAGWILPHENICWVSERHTILHRDERGMPHCEDGPAIAYPDGWALYYLNGIPVDEQIVMRPETQTPKQILKDDNADRKSIRANRFGWPRLLKEIKAKELDSRRNEIEGTEEALFILPDGETKLLATCPTGKPCVIGVGDAPKQIKSCEEAQKWIHRGRIMLART